MNNIFLFQNLKDHISFRLAPSATGHRASGSKDGPQCAKDHCTSWKIRGRKAKHMADNGREREKKPAKRNQETNQ